MVYNGTENPRRKICRGFSSAFTSRQSCPPALPFACPAVHSASTSRSVRLPLPFILSACPPVHDSGFRMDGGQVLRLPAIIRPPRWTAAA